MLMKTEKVGTGMNLSRNGAERYGWPKKDFYGSVLMTRVKWQKRPATFWFSNPNRSSPTSAAGWACKMEQEITEKTENRNRSVSIFSVSSCFNGPRALRYWERRAPSWQTATARSPFSASRKGTV